MAIHFSGKYTEDDVERIALSWIPVPRWLKYVAAFMLFCVTVFVLQTYLQTRDISAFLAYWPVALIIAFAFLIRKGSRRNYRTNQALHDGVHGYADDDHVVFETPYSRLDLPWSKYHRLVTRPGLTMLFSSLQSGQLFPRSFFSSDADWEDFNSLAASKVRTGEVVEVPRGLRVLTWLIPLIFFLWTMWSLHRQ